MTRPCLEVALVAVLAGGITLQASGEDTTTTEANRILATAEAEGQARWAVLVAGDGLADPPVTWSTWGRADQGDNTDHLASGGLRVSTPWGSVQVGARQNSNRQAPGGSLALELPVVDGQPGGRLATWKAARDLAALGARIEAVATFHNAATRALSRLRGRITVWINRQDLALSVRESRVRDDEKSAFPDRFPDRDRTRARAEAARSALESAIAQAGTTDEALVEAILSEAPETMSAALRPVAALFRAQPTELDLDYQTRQAAQLAARQAAATWPTATVNLEMAQPVWGTGTPILGAELRFSGSFGPSQSPLTFQPPTDLSDLPDKAWFDAKRVLAEFDLASARENLAWLEADQQKVADRRGRSGVSDSPAELLEARALVQAKVDVLRAWLMVVEGRVEEVN